MLNGAHAAPACAIPPTVTGTAPTRLASVRVSVRVQRRCGCGAVIPREQSRDSCKCRSVAVSSASEASTATGARLATARRDGATAVCNHAGSWLRAMTTTDWLECKESTQEYNIAFAATGASSFGEYPAQRAEVAETDTELTVAPHAHYQTLPEVGLWATRGTIASRASPTRACRTPPARRRDNSREQARARVGPTCTANIHPSSRVSSTSAHLHTHAPPGLTMQRHERPRAHPAPAAQTAPPKRESSFTLASYACACGSIASSAPYSAAPAITICYGPLAPLAAPSSHRLPMRRRSPTPRGRRAS